MDEVKRNLGLFLDRIKSKNWPAVELRVRVGGATEHVDEYLISEANADRVYQDMIANAQGVGDPSSSFILRAVGNGDEKGPSRAFSIVNHNPAHESDRFDGTDKNTVRLLLDQVHRSHLAMIQVMGQMSQVIGSQSSLQSQLADTHSEAIASLRESRAEQARAEVQMVEVASRTERSGKLLDAGMAMLPGLIEHLTSPGEGKK